MHELTLLQDMAVVIGGTVLSTLLTLFVVPCAYSLFTRLESSRKQARMAEVMQTLSSTSAPPPAS